MHGQNHIKFNIKICISPCTTHTSADGDTVSFLGTCA